MKNSIQRKLGDLQTLINDPSIEFIDSLQSIETNKISSNIPVRNSLEENELLNYKDFIENFSTLTNTLDIIFQSINSIDKSCDSMLKKLSIGDKGVDEVLDMTSALYLQQEKQRAQLTKIHSFINEYYLPEEDFQVLETGDINEKFFDIFSKLESSQDRITIALKSNQPRCLIDASTSLNSIKEKAYQRIYQWLHINSHLFDRQNPTIPSIFYKSLIIIKQKPFLYGFIREELSKVRGSVIGRSFMKALSTGDGENPPLESISNIDPLQFTGDIFAWIHQSTASESTFLSILFKESINSPMIQNALGIVYEVVCRPIESRIIQSIKSLVKPSDLYQITNICSFYYSTFSDICGISSNLVKTLSNLRQISSEEFKKSINESVDGIKISIKPSQGNIIETLKSIQEITKLHRQSSLSSSFDIGTLIESYANEIKNSINLSKEPITFKLNSLYELLIICKESKLQSLEDISKEVDELTTQIIHLEVEEILRRCRILDIFTIIKEFNNSQPLSNIKGMEDSTIKSAMKRFESSLVGSGPLITPLCDLISNLELKQSLKLNVSNLLSKNYEQIFNIITDPKNGYSSPTNLFKHTPKLIKEMILI